MATLPQSALAILSHAGMNSSQNKGYVLSHSSVPHWLGASSLKGCIETANKNIWGFEFSWKRDHLFSVRISYLQLIASWQLTCVMWIHFQSNVRQLNRIHLWKSMCPYWYLQRKLEYLTCQHVNLLLWKLVNYGKDWAFL